MNKAPLIGITSRRYEREEYKTPLIGQHQAYIDAIQQAGGLPILLPLLTEEKQIESLCHTLDGILFSSGEDVHPRHYGEEPHPKLGAVCELRDAMELTLARIAYRLGKPTLAICRGMQVVNVALGGTLYQDIESQMPSAVPHSENFGSGHQTKLTVSSRLSKLLGMTEVSVNTYHHQAVKKSAPNLEIVGSSPDGIVEAFEDPSKKFFMGLQCHPELLCQDGSSGWAKLFREFVAAARS